MLVSDEPRVADHNVIEQPVMNRMEQHPSVISVAVAEASSIDSKKSRGVYSVSQKQWSRWEREGVVRVGHQNLMILPGQTHVVKCNVWRYPLAARQEVLFEPVDSTQWPESLSSTERVVSLQRRGWSKIAIPVTNESSHDITLTPHTVLGYLQQVTQ